MGELVHVVEPDDVVGDEEELGCAHAYRLVHFAGVQKQLHGRVYFKEGLTCLLRHIAAFSELFNQDFPLNQVLKLLILLQLLQYLVFNHLEPFNPDECLAAIDALLSVLLSLKLLKQQGHNLRFECLYRHAEVDEVG